jgi:hypothetical protein
VSWISDIGIGPDNRYAAAVGYGGLMVVSTGLESNRAPGR